MSADLAVVGLSIVPPVAIMAIFYGKYLKRISKNVQVTLKLCFLCTKNSCKKF